MTFFVLFFYFFISILFSVPGLLLPSSSLMVVGNLNREIL